MTRHRVIMLLLAAVMLPLTMRPSDAGATTAGGERVPASLVPPAAPVAEKAMHAGPALLPDRSCVGLLSAADFPGTHYTGEIDNNGQKVCTFSGGTSKVPTGAEVTLKVLASTAAAHAFFITISTASIAGSGVSDQFTKLKGYGNEAVYGQVCSADRTVCGLDVEVRVVNDVFTIAVFRVSTPLVRLAGQVVAELCPKCKFTTSHAPIST